MIRTPQRARSSRWGSLAALVVASALGATTLVGCGSQPTTGPTSPATGGTTASTPSATVTTITYWGRNSISTKNLVDEFNQSHQNIQVELTQLPDDQFITKVGAAVRGGDAPDVLAFDDVNGPLFAATGVLTDITDKVNALDFKDALNPAQIALGTYGGKIYSVPKNSGVSLMLWNKDLFRQAGLDPDTAPASWEQIKADALAIRALGSDIYGWNIPGACGGCLAFTAAPLIWASGGQVLTEPGPDQRSTLSTDPAVAATLEFQRELWTSGVVAAADESQDGSTWAEGFHNGKLGIMLGWPELIKESRDLGVDVGYAPIPGKDGGFATFAGGDNVGLVTGSTQAEAGWEFIQWLLSEEAQLSAMKTDFVTPVRSDIITDQVAADFPEIAVAVKAGTQGGAPVSIAASALMLSADSPWLSAFQRVVFGGEPTDAVLQDADKTAQGIIEQAYKEIGTA